MSTLYLNHHDQPSYQLVWSPFYCIVTYWTLHRNRSRFKWSLSGISWWYRSYKLLKMVIFWQLTAVLCALWS